MLDEKTFLYSDDIDYCIRARLRGYSVRYCPESIVHHLLGGSTNKKAKAVMRFKLRNRYRCLIKNYEIGNLLRWGSYSLVVNLIISPIAYLRKLEFVKALICIYVVFWNFLNFPVRERVKVQTGRVIGDDEILRFSIPSRW